MMENSKPEQILPKTWIVESILVSLFCFPPFGLVGLFFASKVEFYFYSDKFESAQKASQIAKKWIKLGLIVGLFLYLTSFIYFYLKGKFYF